MKILITGISGRVGEVLKRGLIADFDIYGIDIKPTMSQERIFTCDISDLSELVNMFKKLPPIDCVIHLAADHRVDASWESVLKNNIIGTHNVYECVRLFSIPRVVFASSNHVTGMYEGIPPKLHLEENPNMITVSGNPVRPDGDYGSSKVYGEAVARQYFELYGITSICLRIGSLLADDNPTCSPRLKKTWLSHRDLVQLCKKSLSTSVPFGVYYGVSGNSGKFWDISDAEKDLGYMPDDDASKLT